MGGSYLLRWGLKTHILDWILTVLIFITSCIFSLYCLFQSLFLWILLYLFYFSPKCSLSSSSSYSSVWLYLFLKLCHWFIFSCDFIYLARTYSSNCFLTTQTQLLFLFHSTIMLPVYIVGLLHLKRPICPLPTLDRWNYPHRKNSATLRSSFYKVAVGTGKMKGFAMHWTGISMARGCQSAPPFLLPLHLQGKGSWGPFTWYPVLSLSENGSIRLHPPESPSNLPFHPVQNTMPTHADNWWTVLWTRHYSTVVFTASGCTANNV